MKLLYFYMKGCKTCKQQDNEFNKHKPMNVDIVKLDVDDVDTIRLCKKLHIGDAPTMVLMKDYDSTMNREIIDKNFVKKWIDLTKTEEIEREITKHIEI